MLGSSLSTVDSSILNDNTSIHVCDTAIPTTDIPIAENVKNTKRKMTTEQYRQLTDKLLEMKQIKCEERLVYEQIDRLNAERQHLQNLLNVLHAMDSHDRKKNSRRCQRRLQKLDSNSRLN